MESPIYMWTKLVSHYKFFESKGFFPHTVLCFSFFNGLSEKSWFFPMQNCIMTFSTITGSAGSRKVKDPTEMTVVWILDPVAWQSCQACVLCVCMPEIPKEEWRRKDCGCGHPLWECDFTTFPCHVTWWPHMSYGKNLKPRNMEPACGLVVKPALSNSAVHVLDSVA